MPNLQFGFGRFQLSAAPAGQDLMGMTTMAGKIIVTAAGLLLVAGVNWYFLLSGRRKPRRH